MVDRSDVEAELRRRFDAGDLDGTLSAALGAYGGELFGFLVGLAHDRARAEDVFGATCERMWKGLPKFRWTSSFRVWAYTIARNEFLRSLREVSRERRGVPLSQVPSIQQAIDAVKSSTPVHERSAVVDRFAELRKQLEPDDHALLGLRIDRKMSWNEIAEILGAEGDGATPAALRKRFERLKTRLREAARDVT